MHPFRVTLIPLVMLAALVTPHLAFGQGGGKPALWVSVHFDRIPNVLADTAALDGQIAALKDLGLTGARIDISWSEIEQQPGRRDWALPDMIVGALRRSGEGVYAVLAYSPVWARPANTTSHERPTVEGSAARGDSAFAAFAAAAARRYRGSIAGWEIWNEPNSPLFWSHERNGQDAGPDAADYTRLFNLAADSIHAAVPGVPVITGGLATFGGRPLLVKRASGGGYVTGPSAPEFIQGMVRAGIRADGFGLHPYSGLPPGRARPRETHSVFPGLVFDSVLHTLNRATDKRPKVWITEWGVENGGRTEAAVSAWFDAALHHMVCDPQVSHVTIYTLLDPPPNAYGLVTPNGRLTTDGIALKHVLASGLSCGGDS